MISLLALLAGFLLDLLIGDPRWLYHPICVIGNLIAVQEDYISASFFCLRSFLYSSAFFRKRAGTLGFP